MSVSKLRRSIKRLTERGLQRSDSPPSGNGESLSANHPWRRDAESGEHTTLSTLGYQEFPPYAYEPISEGEIRLVTILPAADPNDTVECLLTRHDRSENPGYAAISYTWGAHALVAVVVCNERELKVTENCEAVLRTLRTKDTAQTVWMDVLSIDQSNLPERNIQVAQIGEVFRKARETFACLGGASEIDWNVFDANITDDMWESFLDHPWFTRTWVLQEVLLSRDITIVIGQSRMTWLDLLSLCSARGLELPPLMFIRNDLVHDYGMRPPKSWDTHVDSFPVPNENEDDIREALDASKFQLSSQIPPVSPWRSTDIQNFGADSETMPLSTSGRHEEMASDRCMRNQEGVLGSPTAVSEGKEQDCSPKPDGTLDLNYWMLLEIMKKTWSFQCNDPRDKLFTMLPLFKDQPPELLRVDYNKSVRQVYTDLSYFFLEQGLPDSLFNATGITTLDKPSWVTDWSAPPLRNNLRSIMTESYRAGFQPGSREMRPFRLTNHNIRLRGRLVCPVKRCEYRNTHSIVWEMNGHMYAAKLFLAADEASIDTQEGSHRHSSSAVFSGSLYPNEHWSTDQPGFVEVKRLLISKIIRAAEEIDSSCRQLSTSDEHVDFCIGMDSFSHALLALEASEEIFLSQSIRFERGVGHVNGPKDHQSSLVFEADREYIMQGRCFIYADQAHVGEIGAHCGMGLAPRSVATGDYVCILLGFQVPFIIRRFGDRWELVGECYFFENIMLGALVDDLQWDTVWSDPPDSRLEDFTIV